VYECSLCFQIKGASFTLDNSFVSLGTIVRISEDRSQSLRNLLNLMATSLPTQAIAVFCSYSSASFRFRCCTDRCSGKMRPTIAAKTAPGSMERGGTVEFFSLHGILQVHRQVQMLKHSPRYQSGSRGCGMPSARSLPLTKSTDGRDR